MNNPDPSSPNHYPGHCPADGSTFLPGRGWSHPGGQLDPPPPPGPSAARLAAMGQHLRATLLELGAGSGIQVIVDPISRPTVERVAGELGRPIIDLGIPQGDPVGSERRMLQVQPSRPPAIGFDRSDETWHAPSWTRRLVRRTEDDILRSAAGFAQVAALLGAMGLPCQPSPKKARTASAKARARQLLRSTLTGARKARRLAARGY